MVNQLDIMMVDKEGGREGCSDRYGSPQAEQYQYQGKGIQKAGEMLGPEREIYFFLFF